MQRILKQIFTNLQIVRLLKYKWMTLSNTLDFSSGASERMVVLIQFGCPCSYPTRIGMFGQKNCIHSQVRLLFCHRVCTNMISRICLPQRSPQVFVGFVLLIRRFSIIIVVLCTVSLLFQVCLSLLAMHFELRLLFKRQYLIYLLLL